MLDGPVVCSYSKRIGDAPPPPTAETHGPVAEKEEQEECGGSRDMSARARFPAESVSIGAAEKPMERMLATPADAEIILKLYQLRTESVMREARALGDGRILAGDGGRVVCRVSEPGGPAQSHGCARCLPTGRWRRRWCCTGRFRRSCLWIATARDSFCWPSLRRFWKRIREKNPGFHDQDERNWWTGFQRRRSAMRRCLKACRPGANGLPETRDAQK